MSKPYICMILDLGFGWVDTQIGVKPLFMRVYRVVRKMACIYGVDGRYAIPDTSMTALGGVISSDLSVFNSSRVISLRWENLKLPAWNSATCRVPKVSLTF